MTQSTRAAIWLVAALLTRALPGAAQVPEVPVFGLGAFQGSDPVSITADVLEARESEHERRLSFRRDVRVQQGGLSLRAERLEAIYRSDSREPDRLTARGGARIQEGTRRARCAEVAYDRRARTLVCRGEPAELWDGDDRLSGREFRFDLADHRVDVIGGARLEIHRDWLPALEETEAELTARLSGPGPVTVRSDRLEATDIEGQRTIIFSGDVVVTRDELSLEADELLLNFPAGARQPDRLRADGGVVVREASLREAHCQQAEYRPGLRTVTCRGGSRLRDGVDELVSEELHLDLDARRVEALGRARLRLDPRSRRSPS